jgi:hypothetical protein
MGTTNALTAPCEKKCLTLNGSTPHHTTSLDRNQRVTQAIQPDQTSSRIGHETTFSRDFIREYKNERANIGG